MREKVPFEAKTTLIKPDSKKAQLTFHVKSNDGWKKGEQIAKYGDRVVLSCENPDSLYHPIIRVVRSDLLDRWQKEAFKELSKPD